MATLSHNEKHVWELKKMNVKKFPDRVEKKLRNFKKKSETYLVRVLNQQFLSSTSCVDVDLVVMYLVYPKSWGKKDERKYHKLGIVDFLICTT